MESVYAIAIFALLLLCIVLLLGLLDSQRRGDSFRDAFANECARHDKTKERLAQAEAGAWRHGWPA